MATSPHDWQHMDSAPRDGREVEIKIGASTYYPCSFDAAIGRWRWGRGGSIIGVEPEGWRLRG